MPIKVLRAALMGAVLCTGVAFAQTPDTSPLPIAADEEIVVPAPGPALWRVYDADSEVFVLASIQTLPRRFHWNTRPMQTALARADRLYVENAFAIGPGLAAQLLTTRRDAYLNPDGAELHTFLPADLHARMVRAATALDVDPDSLEGLRPYAAGSRLLGALVEQAGLDNGVDPQDQSRRLARRARVRITEIEAAPLRPLVNALNRMPVGADSQCLAVQLDALERQGPLLNERAAAWARGDIAALRAFSELVDPASCAASLTSGGVDVDGLESRRVAAWTATIRQALQSPGVRVAVVNFPIWLSPQGVLATLRSSGVSVEGD
jgi:uncharacterized protein YbaP (TraB family)